MLGEGRGGRGACFAFVCPNGGNKSFCDKMKAANTPNISEGIQVFMFFKCCGVCASVMVCEGPLGVPPLCRVAQAVMECQTNLLLLSWRVEPPERVPGGCRGDTGINGMFSGVSISASVFLRPKPTTLFLGFSFSFFS